MTGDLSESSNTVIIKSSGTEFSVAPGGSTIIPFKIINSSESSQNFRIIVRGVPANWVKISTPLISLVPGEEKGASVILQPPLRTETGPGNFPVQVTVVNDQDESQQDSIKLAVIVSGYTIHGRIGIMLEATRYTITPGGSATIVMLLQNQGLVEDDFRISVDGIPVTWITTSTPALRIPPGEQHKASMTITLPRDASLPDGPNSFKLQVFSSQAPDQVVEIDCTLTVLTASGFQIEIDPSINTIDQEGTLVIHNNGDFQDTFSVSWESEDESLIFDPAESQQVHVRAGETARIAFNSHQRRRPVIGAEIPYTYQVRVVSSANEGKEAQGIVVGKALLPIWLIPGILLLCLGILSISFSFYVIRDQSGWSQSTETAEIALSATQLAGEEIIPTSTIPGPPTGTPLETQTEPPPPTETPLPTDTFPPPTATPQVIDTPTTTQAVVPDVGRIAFQSNRDGDPELYLQDTATGTIIRLTQSLGVDTQPVFSPDGNRMAFVSDRTGDNEIYIANADGSNPINISNSPGIDQTPAWSPDGQWIVFSTNRDGNLEIYVMRLDGSELSNLSNSPADDLSPSWFVSGATQLIVFQTNRDGNQEIYRMSIDGADQVNLTNNPAEDTIPRGSTSGIKIAFTTNRDGNAEIYLMGLDGSNPINLTQNPAADQYPAWSRDSNWLAFITDRDGNQEIYIIRDDGSEFINVTNNPAADLVPDFQ